MQQMRKGTMSFGTKIAYCHATFNPWTGCSKVSPGCQSCFAERWAKRSGMVEWGPGKPRRRTSESYWQQPLKWNKKAEKEGTRYRVLIDLCDVFDEELTNIWRWDFFQLIQSTPNLIWLVLTKRIKNAIQHRLKDWDMANLWLGSTVCNQEEADRDIPILLSIPAAKHWLSIEPMLGLVDLLGIAFPGSDWKHKSRWKGHQIDWVIVGGETGPGARPMHPDWARSVRDQCQAAGLPFYFKQWGEWVTEDQSPEDIVLPGISRIPKGWDFNGPSVYRVGTKAAGNLLDGQKWEQIPE